MKCGDRISRKRTSFVTRAVSLFVTLCVTAAAVPAAEKLSDLRIIWKAGRYGEVLSRLQVFRDQPYGKTAEVDYMIATSLCRTSEPVRAKKRFQWILDSYRLDDSRRKAVEDAMRQCASNTKPRALPSLAVTTSALASVGVSGKSGYDITRASTPHYAGKVIPLTSESAELVRDIPIEEFEKRLFHVSEKDAAARNLRSLLGTRFKVESSGRFLIASSGAQTTAQLGEVGRGLELYASFFGSQYKMPQPTKLITVYLVPTAQELQDVAVRLHGVKVSDVSIGYSFPYDLSMVGIIFGAEYGTLAHELFHLMVRGNFGDIPPWLEEGLATLYEVSEVRGRVIAGVPNWRGEVLEKLRGGRPTIEQLVRMDWRAFDGTEGQQDLRRQAINHATARYFILYLQETGKLVEVYHAFRQRKVDDVQEDSPTDAVRLLASILRNPLSKVDGDFDKWYEGINGRSPDSDTNRTEAISPAANAPAGNAPGIVNRNSIGVNPSMVTPQGVNASGVDPANVNTPGIAVPPNRAVAPNTAVSPNSPVAPNSSVTPTRRVTPNEPAGRLIIRRRGRSQSQARVPRVMP
ncbi:hypothetical protein BH18ACI4_BH18ACI4_17240 [soil metagenome]